ncbi:ankyrin repeat-containing protein [Tanacetum coccineum]
MVVSSEDSNGQGSCGAVFARWLVAVEGGERDIEMVVRDCEDDDGVKDGARVSICVPPKNAIGNGNDNEDEIRDLETVEHDKVVLDQDDEANDYQDCYNVQQNEVGQDQDCDNVQNYEVSQDLNQENVQRCEVGQDETQEHEKDDMGRNEDQENMQKDVEKSAWNLYASVSVTSCDIGDVKQNVKVRWCNVYNKTKDFQVTIVDATCRFIRMYRIVANIVLGDEMVFQVLKLSHRLKVKDREDDEKRHTMKLRLSRTESYFDICVPLYQASISGDWRTAKDILDTRPELVRYAIAEGNDTALHVVASAEETKLTKRFVKNLVNMMTKEDLEIQNKNDETALCLAATAGNIKMVEIMLKKNPGLLTIEGSRGMLPLYMSALQGRHNTVKYLYAASKTVSSRFWTDEKWGWMLLGCVECDFYDVALQIVKDHPELSTDMSIGVLARKSDAFKRVEKNLIRRIIHSRPPRENHEGILHPLRILFVAAEMGNTIFVIELLRAYPDLIWQKNDDKHTIFHIAVMHRHQGIYNLLYEIGSRKDRITDKEDINGNNMLHLVVLTTVKMRSHTSGASLLMQRELLWFKEVEKMLPAHMRENKNRNDQTPYELFSEMNTDLVTRGLDWMKDCMVVATLIVTVAFAVAFTVPGAYDQTHGLPIFIHHRTLLVFVIADAISLFFSSTSLLVFLSILTSRHAQRDFMYSLPKKLTIGLVTLFISVAAMMVTFSASFFVLYRNGLRWVPILIATFAALPVILFAALQYPLLWDISRSMYDSRYLFKPRKHILYSKGSRF